MHFQGLGAVFYAERPGWPGNEKPSVYKCAGQGPRIRAQKREGQLVAGGRRHPARLSAGMETEHDILEPRLWRRDGWTARVLKNEEDDGWAVEMTRQGDPEPALVGPWTMGRDKKNPKPLDQSAFTTLVKTAAEVIRRHEHAARAKLHKAFSYVRDDGQRVAASMDIAPDEDDPHAILTCVDEATGEPLRTGRVEARFRLSATSVERFLGGG